MAFGAGSIIRRLAGQLSPTLASWRARLRFGSSLFDNVAAAAITFFGIAVTFENVVDMRIRGISLRPVDWLQTIVFASLPPVAAYLLPSQLKGLVAALYTAALLFELYCDGPIQHFRMVFRFQGTIGDLFFGSIVFAVQACLLMGYGVGALARRMMGRRL